jgi:CelD/BcsL family acetyltransferase involved in cellulose biosynthesis
MNIEVVHDPAGFASLRESWNRTLDSSSADSMFLTWEWLYTWWRHWARDAALRILVFRSGRDIVGIAPFMLGARRLPRMFGLRQLEFIGNGTVGSDYLDVIGAQGYEQSISDELAGYLAGRRQPLRLAQALQQHSLISGVARTLKDSHWNVSFLGQSICPYIRLSGLSWDRYLETLGPQHRYNFRRRLRNLDRRFAVELRVAGSHEDAAEFLSSLITLHKMRWALRRSEAFQDDRFCGFHREFSALALNRGWLRLFVLSLDGAPAAALYAFHYKGAFSFYQSGFDPRYEHESVGLVLMGLSIKHAIESDANEYDMLHGDEHYKFLWAPTASRIVGRFEGYPPGLRGELYRVLMQTGRHAKQKLCYDKT